MVDRLYPWVCPPFCEVRGDADIAPTMLASITTVECLILVRSIELNCIRLYKLNVDGIASVVRSVLKRTLTFCFPLLPLSPESSAPLKAMAF